MRAFAYPAQIEEQAPGEFLVTFRDIPEAITGGATLAESFALAVDALGVAIEGYLIDGQAVPDPTPAEAGEFVIPLDPAIAARAALETTMLHAGVSGRALADRMGKDEKHVRRILSGAAKMDQTLEALRVLGVRPLLSFEPPLAA